jgi:hypothetical protein
MHKFCRYMASRVAKRNTERQQSGRWLVIENDCLIYLFNGYIIVDYT